MSTNLPSTEDDHKYLRLYNVEMFQSRLFGAICAAAEFRKASANLARKDLAAMAGKNEATVSRDFSSPRNWTIKTVAEYCYALDIELQFSFIDRTNPERLFLDVGMVCRRVHSAQRLEPEAAAEIENYSTILKSRARKHLTGNHYKWLSDAISPNAPVDNYLTVRREAGDGHS